MKVGGGAWVRKSQDKYRNLGVFSSLTNLGSPITGAGPGKPLPGYSIALWGDTKVRKQKELARVVKL